MRYMLLLMGDESRMNAVPTVEDTGMSAEFAAFHQALVKAGVVVASDRLRAATTASIVRVRDQKAVVLDGPYADTQEQLGGYYVIDVPDLDAAIEWATKCPTARAGTIEVRPVWPTRAP